jgi:DNA-binding protein HU-beta
MTMTKANLIAALAEKTGSQQIQARACLDALEDILTGELLHSGEIPLPGLGRLVVVERAARTGRNPKTGEAIQIPAAKAVKFKIFKGLKDLLN